MEAAKIQDEIAVSNNGLFARNEGYISTQGQKIEDHMFEASLGYTQ